MYISIDKVSASKVHSTISSALKSNRALKLKRRAKKYSYSAVVSHITIIAIIVSMVAVGYQSPVTTADQSVSSARASLAEGEDPTVDQLASATLAAVAAESADMLVATNAANMSRSLSAKGELAQNDDALISKPQIIENSTSRGIKEYTTKDGDNVNTVASAHGVSADTIRWANNLTSDALNANVKLKVPTVTGVVYTVKQGDTAESIASKYKSDASRIVTFNDAEIDGLKPGVQIVLPNGVLPENERPGYRAPTSYAASGMSSRSGGYVTTYGGNMYDRGYCTWYAYNRRAELGRPIGSNWGNAITWASYARSAGFTVSNKPQVGAVLQTGGYYGLGHVAVVEQVNDDGSIMVSEMNYAGWNVKSTRDISASQASAYNYIY